MSPATERYLRRTLAEYKAAMPCRDWHEFDPFAGNDSPEIRAVVDTELGRLNHHSRSRLKSNSYDWRRIDAIMRKHGWTNTNLAFWLGCSSGTIANIRSGHYTGAPMIGKVEELIYGERKVKRIYKLIKGRASCHTW